MMINTQGEIEYDDAPTSHKATFLKRIMPYSATPFGSNSQDFKVHPWKIKDTYHNIVVFNSVNEIYTKLLWNRPQQEEISVYLKEELIVVFKSEFSLLAKKIEHSKYILDLADNWDEEGSAGYSKTVWIQAVKFLANYADHLFENIRKILETPEIYHGPNGTIDILWESKGKFQLLLNIDEKGLVNFYGDNFQDQKVEGKFNVSDYQFILIPFICNYS